LTFGLPNAMIATSLMDALEVIRLTPLMSRSQGRRELFVAMIDGPVALDHPDLAQSGIKEIQGGVHATCSRPESVSCMHGTFVAGILAARRGSPAPAICPGCTLLVRPIFSENKNGEKDVPRATAEDLSNAIGEVIAAGANVINLSAALEQPSRQGHRRLEQILDYAATRSVLVVAAAGNQRMVGSTAITRHPWVIPVTSCDLQGRPTEESNLGWCIGRRGLAVPAVKVVSLGTADKPQVLGGTSAAAPFLSGAIALLWSEFPKATAARIKLAITDSPNNGRRTIAPPILNAWAAYQAMTAN
jgi:subtilisin family serine protease